MNNEFLHDRYRWHWRGWLLCRARFTPLLPVFELNLLAGDHNILLPDQIRQSVPKRQAEYLAGLGLDPQQRLGVDLQHWLSAVQYQELAPAILTPEEQHWCQSEPVALTLPRLLTLIFAAKEALYKALYPDCRQFMEFSAAKVRALTSQQILLQLTVDWSDSWRAGTEIWLDYQLEAAWLQVLTEVSTRAAS